MKMHLLLAAGICCLTALSVLIAEAAVSPGLRRPDYADRSNWASLPNTTGKRVDVFYVYPTVYYEKAPRNMDISRADLRKEVQRLLVVQGSIFSDSANLFAPYYRQMSLQELDPDADIFENKYFRIGATDIYRAFEYYITRLNPDRPFILAGHSQGSMVLLDLMRKRFRDPALQKRLVAAYIIGYSVTAEDLEKYPWLKIAQHDNDIGVIITYNTQAPGATGSPVLKPGAISVNPLNWTTDETPAPKTMNLGAVFFDPSSDSVEANIPQYTGARVDKATGALFTTPPDTPKLDTGVFPKGVYHRYDYTFWFKNLQENVSTRIIAYSVNNIGKE